MGTEKKKKNEGKPVYVVSADTMDFLMTRANEWKNTTIVKNPNITEPQILRGTLSTIIEIPDSSAVSENYPFRMTESGGNIFMQNGRVQVSNVTAYPYSVGEQEWAPGAGFEYVWVVLTLSGDGLSPIGWNSTFGHGPVPPTPTAHKITYTVSLGEGTTSTGI